MLPATGCAVADTGLFAEVVVDEESGCASDVPDCVELAGCASEPAAGTETGSGVVAARVSPTAEGTGPVAAGALVVDTIGAASAVCANADDGTVTVQVHAAILIAVVTMHNFVRRVLKCIFHPYICFLAYGKVRQLSITRSITACCYLSRGIRAVRFAYKFMA